MEDLDSEDEAVALSSHTMDILNQFLAEKKEMEENTAKDPFAENWAMSQVKFKLHVNLLRLYIYSHCRYHRRTIRRSNDFLGPSLPVRGSFWIYEPLNIRFMQVKDLHARSFILLQGLPDLLIKAPLGGYFMSSPPVSRAMK